MTLSDYFDKLYASQDEEEICEWLIKIIKNFNSSFYKEELKRNPLFYSIIKDIKGQIANEMSIMIDKIKVEIEVMDEQLLKTKNNEEFLKLKDIRREYVYLLTALDSRLHSLYML